ncbi:sulfite exporter TauE/SafE family protein [Rivularia sp. UHCC 0363]|uniref:sulfite exporter TauE/SafE family protein n=1 Tax=Rivularia sp. UHCC 0363 TaxID=3110244 RepID=UPI002B21740C|nr:sulfite exporter TauE/SafE family protein [Rivularia sp. UHCC 0363]MEA5598079.1 sulfite exporter TauE/SafE family protein [Rivularia sp. UHCC 0363]
MENWLLLTISGLVSGILAGLLGIGGGTVLVPLQLAFGYTPLQAVATSSLAIVITATSGTIQNWRMGFINIKQVILLGIPAVITAYFSAGLAKSIPPKNQLVAFGILLLFTIYLVDLRKNLSKKQEAETEQNQSKISSIISRIVTGGTAGILAGIFGVGGGVIMVPLQIILLGETIKVAIQTSLGVIVMSSLSAATRHAFEGNILLVPGLILGFGGLIGAQISTRFLPKLKDQVVSLMFRVGLAILAAYVFWKASTI